MERKGWKEEKNEIGYWTKSDKMAFAIYIVGYISLIAIFYEIDPSLSIASIIMVFGTPFIFALFLYIDSKHYENTRPIVWAILGYLFSIIALVVWAIFQSKKKRKEN